MELINSFTNFCAQFSEDTHFYVALSCGLDSSVLLQLISSHKNVTAIHVNHSLSPHAESWVQHCKRFCNNLKIPLLEFTVNAQASTGESPENIAREKRYEIFQKLITT